MYFLHRILFGMDFFLHMKLDRYVKLENLCVCVRHNQTHMSHFNVNSMDFIGFNILVTYKAITNMWHCCDLEQMRDVREERYTGRVPSTRVTMNLKTHTRVKATSMTGPMTRLASNSGHDGKKMATSMAREMTWGWPPLSTTTMDLAKGETTTVGVRARDLRRGKKWDGLGNFVENIGEVLTWEGVCGADSLLAGVTIVRP